MGVAQRQVLMWLAHLRDILGTKAPSIAFGTWTLGNGQPATDHVDQALETGFDHIGMFSVARWIPVTHI